MNKKILFLLLSLATTQVFGQDQEYRNIQFDTVLNRSKLGYRLRAIRDQSDAASSLGIHVSKYKIIAFVISAMIMAPMGSIYAQYVLIVDPNNAFNVDISILVLLPVVL